MTGPRHDYHDRVLREIESQLATLEAGAPATSPDRPAATSQELEEQLESLRQDRALLLQHWKVLDGVVAADAPTRARACGSDQPCPHVLGLASKYRIV